VEAIASHQKRSVKADGNVRPRETAKPSRSCDPVGLSRELHRVFLLPIQSRARPQAVRGDSLAVEFMGGATWFGHEA